MAVELEFVSVIVSVLIALCWTVEGVNVFATAGPERFVTVSVAVAAAVFEAALLAVTAPMGMLLIYEFGTALVTSTLTVQLPAAGMLPPLNAMLPAPAFAVTAPPHVLAAFGVAALTTF